MAHIHVLLVDDDPSFLEAVQDSLEGSDEFIFDYALSAEESLNTLKQKRIDVVVADYAMPGTDGIELTRQIRAFSSIPIIMLTGKGKKSVVIDAINSGVDYYLQKGEDPDILFSELSHMIRLSGERKHNQDIIQEREHNSREVFHHSPIATILCDPKGCITDINPAAITLFGITDEQKIKNLSVFHTIVNTKEVGHLQPGETYTCSTSFDFDAINRQYPGIFHQKGTIIIDAICIPITTIYNSISGYYIQIIDHTAENRVREKLLQTSEQLGLAIQGSQLGLWDWYVQTGETKFNERWAEIIGYSLKDLEPTTIQTWGELTHPDDLSRSNELIEKHFSGEIPYYECEARMRHKDGHWVWILDRGKVVERDQEGRPVRMAGTHTDISERKRAEEEIRENKEKLHLILDSTAEAIYGLDLNGNCTYCNAACVNLLRYSRPDELIGRNMHTLIHHTRKDGKPFPVEDCRIFQAFQRGEGTHVDDEVLWRADSTSFAAEYWSYPQYRDGAIVGAVVTFLDITQRRDIEERLHRKRAILDAISYAATTLMKSLRDDSIATVIEKIGKASNASRSYLFIHSYAPDGTSLISMRYEWVSEGVSSQLNNPELQNLDWVGRGYKRWGSILMSGGVIFGKVEDFPEYERSLLTSQDIKSLVVVPIFSGDTFFGFIGLDDCITDHTWENFEIDTLTVAAGLLGASFGRKLAEEEVLSSESNFSAFFNTTDDFLFVLDNEGNIVKVNSTVIRRLGYQEDELIGRSVLLVHPERRRQEAFEYMTEMLQGTRDMCPIPLLTRDGVSIPVETRVVPGVWNGKNALFGVSKDISAITLSEEKFSKAFHSGGALMALYDLESRTFIEVNKSFLDLLGYSREEVIGKTVDDLTLCIDPQHRMKILSDISETGSSRNNRIQIRATDHRILTGIVSADIIQIQDNALLLIVMNDITEIVRLSDALLQANKKLNILSSITRHDILNQVQILLFLQIFFNENKEAKKLYEREIDMLSKTVSTIHHQILFTRDYQDMGVLAPVWTQVSLVIQKQSKNAIFSDIEIECSTGSLEIFADPMFSKVCFNLMENALRHGERVSQIRVSFEQTPEHGILIFEDDGVGVPMDEKKKIFDRGFGKNTGFGLFLSAEILSLTGMTIRETGEAGKGARFEITIPNGGFRLGT